MDAVRSDHDIGRAGCPVGEVGHGAVRHPGETRTPVPGTHRARRQLLREQGEQIGAVDPDVCSRAGELMWPCRAGRPSGEPELGRDVPRAQSRRPPRRPRAVPASAARSAPATLQRRPRPSAAPARTPGRRFRPAPAQPPLRSRRSRHRSPPPATSCVRPSYRTVRAASLDRPYSRATLAQSSRGRCSIRSDAAACSRFPCPVFLLCADLCHQQRDHLIAADP